MFFDVQSYLLEIHKIAHKSLQITTTSHYVPPKKDTIVLLATI